MFSVLEEALVDVDFHALLVPNAEHNDRAMPLFYDPLRTSVDFTTFVQPASLDVPLSTRCILAKHKVLPHGTDIEDLLPSLQLAEMHVPDRTREEKEQALLLLKDQTYLIYCGYVSLPQGLRASFSPRSSIGRLDVMVRTIIDRCGFYDTIPLNHPGGNLWIEVTPRSFHVSVVAGIALSQMMLFQHTSTTPLAKEVALSHLTFDKDGKEIEQAWHDQALILRIGLTGTDALGVIGFESVPCSEVVHLEPDRPQLSSRGFFRTLRPHATEQGGLALTLEKDHFYILATREHVRIPPDFSAEMVPFSQHIGELRAHYAGFFDPGFGFHAKDKKQGTIAVLEVRPHENIRVLDGQPIALMRFFRNTSSPRKCYGLAQNHYQHQSGPQLAKYFHTPWIMVPAATDTEPLGVKRRKT